MRPIRIDLSTESGQQTAIEIANNLKLRGRRAVFELMPEKRSRDQNAMSFALYQQIGLQAEDQSIKEIRQECKLNYGIHILCGQDEGFAARWGKVESVLSYEERLAFIEDFPVTRLMKKAQFSAYLDEIIREYSKQGYCLVHPSEAA